MMRIRLLKNICVIFLIGAMLFSYPNVIYANSIVEKNVKEITLDNIDVVVVPYEKINSMIQSAKKLIDEGKTLYIASPECSNEELAALFSIPKDDITIYNPLVLLATSIYKLNTIYVFENHYAVVEGQQEIISEKKKSFYDKVITVKEKNSSGELNFTLVPEQSIDNAVKSQKSTIDFVNQLNNKLIKESRIFPSRIYAASTETYTLDGKRIGLANIVQSNIDVGYISVNNQKQYVYDLITKFEVFPNSNNYVVDYKGRMHCNITGHTSLGSELIIPNIPYNNIGNKRYNFEFKKYNFEFQEIIDSSLAPNVYDWTAKSKGINVGKGYHFISEILVATTNSSGSRGGFSSMFLNSDIVRSPIRKFSFEIGGWF